MRTESVVIILILLSIFTSGCTTNQTLESDGNKIITSFTEHQTLISDYSGTVSLSSDSMNRISESYKIHVRYPDKYKVEYVGTSGHHEGTVSILNGSEFLEYDPLSNMTTLSEINPEGNSLTSRDYQGLLNRIIPVGNISYAGVEYRENHPFYIIEIRQEKLDTYFDLKYSEYRFSLARAWVDPDSWSVKRIELDDFGTAQPIVTADYKDLLVNRGIPDDIFNPEQYKRGTIITPPTHPPRIFPDI